MNKTTPWSPTEENQAMARRAEGFTYVEISEMLGRSLRSVEKKFAKLRKLGDSYEPRDPKAAHAAIMRDEPASITNGPEVSKEEIERRLKVCRSAPQEETCEERAAYWKKEAQRLQGTLSSQQHEKTAVEILVEKAVELAPIAYVPPKEKHWVAGRKGGSEQSAVLLLSDCHVGQVVEAEQTLGFGGYNFDIFLRRLAHLERSIFSILQDHTTSQVPEIVVAMLGDFLHGNLQHAVEAGQQTTLFAQFYSAGHAISQFLRNLSALAPLRIHAVVGNHPRWNFQHKMPCDNRFSNLDFFLYSYVQALTRDIPRITWNLDKQPFAVFTILDFVFQCSHGEELRGGDKALGIPNHSVGRRVSATTQMRAMTGQPPVNYYCTGHLHRPIDLPHSLGEIVINGGFPGVDGFGVSAGFTPSRPSQRFFLIHKKYGRTASYNLRLDFGDTTPHEYQLPTDFQCR